MKKIALAFLLCSIASISNANDIKICSMQYSSNGTCQATELGKSFLMDPTRSYNQLWKLQYLDIPAKKSGNKIKVGDLLCFVYYFNEMRQVPPQKVTVELSGRTDKGLVSLNKSVYSATSNDFVPIIIKANSYDDNNYNAVVLELSFVSKQVSRNYMFATCYDANRK